VIEGTWGSKSAFCPYFWDSLLSILVSAMSILHYMAGVLYGEPGQYNPHAARAARKQAKKAARRKQTGVCWWAAVPAKHSVCFVFDLRPADPRLAC
jgi:hypothetical protein